MTYLKYLSRRPLNFDTLEIALFFDNEGRYCQNFGCL